MVSIVYGKLVTMTLTPRSGFAAGFALCAGLLGFAYYLQYVELQNPCPLCMVQTKVLAGSGECAEAGWKFLGLTIAGWSLLWLVVLGLFALYVGLRKPRTL